MIMNESGSQNNKCKSTWSQVNLSFQTLLCKCTQTNKQMLILTQHTTQNKTFSLVGVYQCTQASLFHQPCSKALFVLDIHILLPPPSRISVYSIENICKFHPEYENIAEWISTAHSLVGIGSAPIKKPTVRGCFISLAQMHCLYWIFAFYCHHHCHHWKFYCLQVVLVVLQHSYSSRSQTVQTGGE